MYVYIYTHTNISTTSPDGMSWVNFNFKFLSNIFKNCAKELEVDIYSTLVSAVGVLFGTTVVRYVVDTYVVPWWIRRGVSMCVCVCMCFIPWYIHIYMHTHTHTHVCRAPNHLFTAQKLSLLHAHIHTSIHNVASSVDGHTLLHTHTYIHCNTYIHAHVHTQGGQRTPFPFSHYYTHTYTVIHTHTYM
jgi:hypothetical protein